MTLTIDQAFEQAVALHREGQWNAAEQLYLAIVAAQPRHAETQHNLGVLLLSLNRSHEALPRLKAALESQPNSGQYWLSYIEGLIVAGHHQMARQVITQGEAAGLSGETLGRLKKRVAMQNDSPPPVVRAILEREAGHYKAGITILEPWLSSHPQDAEAHALLGHLFLLGGQLNRARAAIDQAQMLAPELSIVLRNRARLLLREGKLEAALAAAKAACDGDSMDPENRVVLASALGAAGQTEQALGLLEKAMQARPSYAEAYATRATLRLRLGDASGALADAERALAIKPHLVQLWGTVGMLRYQCSNLPGAIDALRRALEAEPGNVTHLANLGEFLRQDGQLDAAICVLRDASDQAPGDPVVWTNLGAALQEAGQANEARAAYTRALAIQPESPEVASNLGALAMQEEDWEDALHHFDRALFAAPTQVAILANRSHVLSVMGRYSEGETTARTAIGIDPGSFEGLLALAIALSGLRRDAEALVAFDQLSALTHGNARNIQRLSEAFALHFRARQQWVEAEHWMRQAWAASPHDIETLNGLSGILLAQDKAEQAMRTVLVSLGRKETQAGKTLFCQCLKQFIPERYSVVERYDVYAFACRALAEGWTRPNDIAPAAVSLFRDRHSEKLRNTANVEDSREICSAIQCDPLLLNLMWTTPVASVVIERFLTKLRRVLLHSVLHDGGSEQAEVLEVACALAAHCFINEYIYDLSPDEEINVRQLTAAATTLPSGSAPEPLPLAVLAAYLPLHCLPVAKRLLQCDWPPAVSRLLTLQILEPFEEALRREEIEQMTPIDNSVSAAVREQYEQNPYPRWTVPAPAVKALSIDTFLRRHLPAASFLPLDKAAPLDILIAGCGTGQHAVDRARSFPNARILAIDLSMSSLAYASRKSREEGITNVRFAQADLLQLGQIPDQFDVIESVGVLHHLEDPMLGWRVLLAKLRPGGFMNVGLYSALARRAVVAVRDWISARGFRPNADDIRRCRQELLSMEPCAAFESVLRFRDFFSMSECRDLLFHVQEHRMSLREVNAFLAENDLTLLGFHLDPRTARLYREAFPQDPQMVDLACWHRFEESRPDTFAAMYQFWLQKKPLCPQECTGK